VTLVENLTIKIVLIVTFLTIRPDHVINR